MDNKFGPLLKETRQWREMSQSRLGVEADVDHSYINRLESGIRMPSREVLERILRALKLSQFDDRGKALLDAAGYHIPGSITTFGSLELSDLNTVYNESDYETKKEINYLVRFITESIKRRNPEGGF